MVIGPGNPKRVNKSPWECRIRKWADDTQGKKWAKDAQGKRNEPKEPTSSVMGQENPK